MIIYFLVNDSGAINASDVFLDKDKAEKRKELLNHIRSHKYRLVTAGVQVIDEELPLCISCGKKIPLIDIQCYRREVEVNSLEIPERCEVCANLPE